MISPSQRIEMSISTASSSSFGRRSIKPCLRYRCACGRFVAPEDDPEECDRLQNPNTEYSSCSMSSITKERDSKKRCRECKFKYEHGHNVVAPPTEISINRMPKNVYNNILPSAVGSPRDVSDFPSDFCKTNEPNKKSQGKNQILSITEDNLPGNKYHQLPGQEVGSDQLGEIINNQSETFVFDPFNLGDCQPLHFDNSVSQSSQSTPLPLVNSVSFGTRKQQENCLVPKRITNLAVDSDDDGMSDNVLPALSQDSDEIDSVQLLASIDISATSSLSPKLKENGQNTKHFAHKGFDSMEGSQRHYLKKSDQSNIPTISKIWFNKKDRLTLRARRQVRDSPSHDLEYFDHDLSYIDRKQDQIIKKPENSRTDSKDILIPSSEGSSFNYPDQPCISEKNTSKSFCTSRASEPPSPDLNSTPRFANSKSNQHKSKIRYRPKISLFDKGSDDCDEMRDEMPSVIIRVNDGISMVRQGINPTQYSDTCIAEGRSSDEMRTVESSNPLTNWGTLVVNPCLSFRSFVSSVSDTY